MKISTVDEMRQMDKTAIKSYGIVEEILMENAGAAAFRVLDEAVGGVLEKRILILCGAGNNGGDGLVVARKVLSAMGTPVVALLGDPNNFKGAALTNYQAVMKIGIRMVHVNDAESLAPELDACDAVVDGIFGTGLTREVEGRYRDVIEAVNRSRQRRGLFVLSLDIPSGVHGDTGRVMGVAVNADATVTFGLPKIGNLLHPGYALCGALSVTHISFPPVLHASDAINAALNPVPELPERRPDGHKSTFGDALFIAGASSYYGAPRLAAYSFMKAGGGYARLAAPASVIPVIAATAGELVFAPQAETDAGTIAMKNRDALLRLAEVTDITVLGPGLSLEPETQSLVRELVGRIARPLILDGDGLTAVVGDLDLLRSRNMPTILTPHPGEMSRLTGLPIARIAENAVDVVRKTAKDLGATIVYKAANTVIGHPDGRIFINIGGNSGMGTAGSGDVLAGTIAAMAGLGLSMDAAARSGVFVHALAGDLAAGEIGEDGVTAGDIMAQLPKAMCLPRAGLPERWRARYVIPEIR